MKISNLIKIKQRKLGGNGLSHTFVLFSKHGTHVQMVYCSLYYVFVYGEEPGCRLKLVCITCVCFYFTRSMLKICRRFQTMFHWYCLNHKVQDLIWSCIYMIFHMQFPTSNFKNISRILFGFILLSWYK